jgi:predicted DNA-binding transcriptional regulator YafY
MNIELTNDEAQALVQLLDIAVKAGGLRVTQPALAIAQKIDAAAAESGAKPE